MHFIITYFSDTNKISWKLKMKAIKDAFDNQNLALARKLANEVIFNLIKIPYFSLRFIFLL